MKKYILLSLILQASIAILPAQIGVFTENPLSIFHVDPLSNTDSSQPATYSDDVIFIDGKLGLGVLNPDRSLDLKTSFRYSDGNEAANYVLYVNDQKDIGWEREKGSYPPMVEVPSATLTNAFQSFQFPNNSVNTYRYTGVNITLTTGLWLVYLKTTFSTWWNSDVSGNIRALISTSPTGNGLSTSIGAITSSASTNGGSGYLSGYVFLSVNELSKTYYLWLGYISDINIINGPSYNSDLALGVNSFYAIRYSRF